MAYITVKGKPFFYQETDYNTCGQHVLNPQDAEYILIKTKEILDRNNINFMPMFGTLLGIVRQNGFIPNDHDMDIAIWGKDRQNLIDLIPEFEKEGIKFTRCSEPYVYTFIYKSADCDFYTLMDSEKIYSWRYVKLVAMYIPRYFFTKTQQIEFLGTTFNVPQNPERLLTYFYGKDWRIPKSGKPARVQSKLLFWINAKRFIQRCISYIKRHYLNKL